MDKFNSMLAFGQKRVKIGNETSCWGRTINTGSAGNQLEKNLFPMPLHLTHWENLVLLYYGVKEYVIFAFKKIAVKVPIPKTSKLVVFEVIIETQQ